MIVTKKGILILDKVLTQGLEDNTFTAAEYSLILPNRNINFVVVCVKMEATDVFSSMK